MKMTCRACKRPMNGTAFITQVSIWLGTKLGPLAAQTLIPMIMNYFATKKGFLDDVMATVANNVGFECPQCKKATCWDGTPDGEIRSERSPLLCDDDHDVVSF